MNIYVRHEITPERLERLKHLQTEIDADPSRFRRHARDPLGLGGILLREQPALFEACGCTRDVVPVLDRAGTDISGELLAKVAGTLQKKNPQLSVEEIEAFIHEARGKL